MWLRRLRIHAFGGLTDRELQLAPGLTVVHGPNESAKSTWHAALTVALCGRRRGAGRRQSDAAFEARHRPWDQPDRWAVGLDLVLDDGREIEIERDLLQQLVTVVDTGLGGRPVPDDLIRQGSPDGAVWLGLDRDTFPMTASGKVDTKENWEAFSSRWKDDIIFMRPSGNPLTKEMALAMLSSSA